MAAVLTALVVWAVAVPILGVELRVSTGATEQAVGPAAIVLVGLVASLLGWASLALLERRTGRGRAIWTGVAAVVLLLSLAGPITGAADTGTAITLVLMHLAVGGVLIAAMRRPV